ncbi:hypothetical protein R6Z07M_017617 [Ovis aries]
MDSRALPRPAPPAPGVPGCCAVRRRPESPELLRCSRRRRPGAMDPGSGAAAVARRNERERNRVKLVNLGFQALRQHVPHGGASKKLSKVETLRSAVEYIRALQRLLAEHDAVRAALAGGLLAPAARHPLPRAPSGTPATAASPSCASSSPGRGHSSEPGSPRSAYSGLLSARPRKRWGARSPLRSQPVGKAPASVFVVPRAKPPPSQGSSRRSPAIQPDPRLVCKRARLTSSSRRQLPRTPATLSAETFPWTGATEPTLGGLKGRGLYDVADVFYERMHLNCSGTLANAFSWSIVGDHGQRVSTSALVLLTSGVHWPGLRGFRASSCLCDAVTITGHCLAGPACRFQQLARSGGAVRPFSIAAALLYSGILSAPLQPEPSSVTAIPPPPAWSLGMTLAEALEVLASPPAPPAARNQKGSGLFVVQAGRDFRVRVATRRPPLPTLVRAEGVLRECPSRTGAGSGSPVASHGPGDAVSSSPWASPDAETLMLTTGVHSHPDLGRAVALPTLGSRLGSRASLWPRAGDSQRAWAQSLPRAPGSRPLPSVPAARHACLGLSCSRQPPAPGPRPPPAPGPHLHCVLCGAPIALPPAPVPPPPRLRLLVEEQCHLPG